MIDPGLTDETLMAMAARNDGGDPLDADQASMLLAQLLYERAALKKTAKQLVDMQSVLGCIGKRVERFARHPASPPDEFVVDLQRMLGEP